MSTPHDEVTDPAGQAAEPLLRIAVDSDLLAAAAAAISRSTDAIGVELDNLAAATKPAFADWAGKSADAFTERWDESMTAAGKVLTRFSMLGGWLEEYAAEYDTADTQLAEQVWGKKPSAAEAEPTPQQEAR